MKTIVASSTSLLIGVAIGWFAKLAPSGLSAQDPALRSFSASAAPLGPTEGFSAHIHGAAPSERSEKASSVDAKRIAAEKAQQDGQNAVVQRLVGVQRKKFESRLAKLVAELGLTPDQKQAAMDRMEKRFAFYGDLLDADGSALGTMKMHQAMAELKMDPLEEILSSGLEGEQLSKYREIKAEEMENKTTAKALKDLSALSTTVDGLSQEQRDAIYQAFSDRASSELGGESIAQIYDSIGVQVDDEFGMEQVMADHAEELDGADPVAANNKLNELLKEKMEDRIAALKPFLSDAQLQQYRSHLEDKAFGMLGVPAEAQANARESGQGEGGGYR